MEKKQQGYVTIKQSNYESKQNVLNLKKDLNIKLIKTFI